jgi:hypothetical protein
MDIPSVKPHHTMTCESKPTDARYRSPGDQAMSVTSTKARQKHNTREVNKYTPLSCPGRRFKGFQPSTFISSEPHTLPLAILSSYVSV